MHVGGVEHNKDARSVFPDFFFGGVDCAFPPRLRPSTSFMGILCTVFTGMMSSKTNQQHYSSIARPILSEFVFVIVRVNKSPAADTSPPLP
jgi:hypothetical protein